MTDPDPDPTADEDWRWQSDLWLSDADQDWRWQSYLWLSDTGEEMLENLLGVRNEAELAAREYAETTKRALEIALGKVDIPQTRDWPEWRAIHTHLFGNIYRWAGRPRTVRIWKNDLEFLQPKDLAEFLPRVFDRAKKADWPNMTRTTFVATTAGLFMDLNWAHPFREGNGRATQIFLDRITSTAPWRLDFSRVTPADWERASYASRPIDYQPPKDLSLLLQAFVAMTVQRAPAATPPAPSTDPPGLQHDNALPGASATPRPSEGAEIGTVIDAAGLTSGHSTPSTVTSADPPPSIPAELDPGTGADL